MQTMGRPGDFFHKFASAFDTLYDNQRNSLMRCLDQKFRSDIFIRFTRTFEMLEPIAGKTVLDIGCGSGPYVLKAFKRGAAQVTAIDPAANMLNLVKKKLAGTPYSQRCIMVQGTVPQVNVEPHDYVIIMGVLDYIADAPAFLRAIRQMTKEICVISFPSRHWLRSRLRKARYFLRNCPVYFYEEPIIRKLCEEAGFAKINIYKIPGAGMDYHVTLG
ncbi:MAG: methyltransferase domain-containing protein [Deltaproteobacteria bacterium]|nr:methyltransferase domain-containing protein [Deltaproteobacteria bacterium]